MAEDAQAGGKRARVEADGESNDGAASPLPPATSTSSSSWSSSIASSPSSSQQWALQTAALGGLGASFGAVSAFLSRQPVGLTATAFAVNSTVTAGLALALRSGMLALQPPPVADARPASALASGLVGGGLTALVLGPRRMPAGALLWAAGGFAGQHAVDVALAWRAAEASAIVEERRRQSRLPGAVGAEAPFGDWRSPRAFGIGADAGDRSDSRAASVGCADGAGASDVGPGGGDAGAASPPAASWARAWLPFYRSSEEDERSHLAKLQARLSEVDVELGLRPPPPPDARATT